MTGDLGFPPGRYWVDAATGNGPTGSRGRWTTKSITAGGRDLSGQPLEASPGQQITGLVITMSDEPTEISGSVAAVSASARPRSVVLFPTDPRWWNFATDRLRTASVTEDGRYAFRAVRPGDYRLATIPVADLPAPPDLAAFLKQLLPLSVPVSMKLGERRIIDLTAK